MKKKVLLIVIPILLVIIIALSVVVAILVGKTKSIGSSWGDTYYTYLKEALNEKDLGDAEEKYGMKLGMENAKIQFCEVSENEDPAMIMTYSKDANTYVNVYQITKNDKVTYMSYKQPTEVEYLYSIEKDEYGWYVHESGATSDSYSNLKNVVDNLKENSTKSDESENVNIAELEAEYTINKDEAETTVTTNDGEQITVKKFDEIFVKPEVELNKSFDFDINMSEKELKEAMTNSVEEYKKDSKFITDEVKESVNKKAEETKENKKVAEEIKAKNDIIVGDWVLDSNFRCNDENITGLTHIFGTSINSSTNTLTLKEDGSFSFYLGLDYNTTGKYKFENNAVTVYEVKDAEQSDTKSIEEKLKFEYVEHNNHQFLKMYLYRYEETFEAYLFFEKNTSGEKKTIMSDEVPTVTFKKAIKPKAATNNTQNTDTSSSTNTSSDSSGIKVGKYTLKYGKYVGTDAQYTDDRGVVSWDVTITLKPDGTYTYESSDQSMSDNRSGKYRVSKMGNDGVIYLGEWPLGVYRNNALTILAGSGASFEYKGN